MAAETELKLSLHPSAVAALLRHPALRDAKAGRARRTRVISTYYDTRAFALAGQGIALRLRLDGQHWLQAVKGPPLPATAGALVSRDEHEWPLGAGQIDTALLTTTPWATLLARVMNSDGFGPQFVTDFERRAMPVRLGARTQALVCVDVGHVRTPDGERQRDISELEIEIVDGDPVDLFAFAATLAADLPLSVSLTSKAARGIALVRGKPDGWDAPVRAAAIALPPGTRAAEALAAALRECVRQVAANAPGLLADANPEWVHQMRIGTRRLRACLGLIAPLLPPAATGQLIAEVRWLGRALGAIRDVDVFVDATLRPLAQALADDPLATVALSPLRDAATDAQQHRRDAARRAVASARFTRIVLATGALATAARFGVAAPTEGDDALARPAGTFATALMVRRHARLVAHLCALRGGTAEERHRARIASKKLRYISEFLGGAFPKAGRVRRFIDALAAVQDVLGHGNDALVASRLARELAGDDPRLAIGAGSVVGWVAAAREPLDAALAAAVRRYRRTDPFWHRD